MARNGNSVARRVLFSVTIVENAKYVLSKGFLRGFACFSPDDSKDSQFGAKLPTTNTRQWVSTGFLSRKFWKDGEWKWKVIFEARTGNDLKERSALLKYKHFKKLNEKINHDKRIDLPHELPSVLAQKSPEDQTEKAATLNTYTDHFNKILSEMWNQDQGFLFSFLFPRSRHEVIFSPFTLVQDVQTYYNNFSSDPNHSARAEAVGNLIYSWKNHPELKEINAPSSDNFDGVALMFHLAAKAKPAELKTALISQLEAVLTDVEKTHVRGFQPQSKWKLKFVVEDAPDIDGKFVLILKKKWIQS